MQLKRALWRLFGADSEAWLISRRRIGSRPRPWRPQPRWQQQRARRRQLLQPHARIPPQQVSCGDVPTTQRLPVAIHHRIIPKTSAVARGIAGMFGRAICTLAQPFPSPPQSAWHGPPDHQLKKFFRSAGRQVRPFLDKALFSSGGAPQKGRVFVQKALLTGLVPLCSIAPGSSRGGLSLGLFLCQVEPPLSCVCRPSAAA